MSLPTCGRERFTPGDRAAVAERHCVALDRRIARRIDDFTFVQESPVAEV
jgi:hypothetical protein